MEQSEIHTCLILVKFKNQKYTELKELHKLMRTLEYLVLRRVHSLNSVELSKIIQSYCHFMRQEKLAKITTETQ